MKPPSDDPDRRASDQEGSSPDESALYRSGGIYSRPRKRDGKNLRSDMHVSDQDASDECATQPDRTSSIYSPPRRRNVRRDQEETKPGVFSRITGRHRLDEIRQARYEPYTYESNQQNLKWTAVVMGIWCLALVWLAWTDYSNSQRYQEWVDQGVTSIPPSPGLAHQIESARTYAQREGGEEFKCADLGGRSSTDECPSGEMNPVLISNFVDQHGLVCWHSEDYTPDINEQIPDDRAMTADDLTRLARPSVVKVNSRTGSGSGWIYEVHGETARILTNDHVVPGIQSSVEIEFDDGKPSVTGKVIETHRAYDLAVIEVCCHPDYQALPLAAPGDIEVGADVAAFGFPDRQGVTESMSVSVGIISTYDYSDSYGIWIVQTDAAVNPGNSGGPILNGDGKVVGIVSFGVSQSSDGRDLDNLGFGIAPNTVRAFLDNSQVLASPTSVCTAVWTSHGLLQFAEESGLECPDINAVVATISGEGSLHPGCERAFSYAEDFQASQDRSRLIWLLVVFTLIFVAFPYLSLIHRASRNMLPLKSKGQKHTPEWGVLHHFIPVLNFFRPGTVLRELYKGSTPDVSSENASAWKSKGRVRAIVYLWWALWIAAWLFNPITIPRYVNPQTLPEVISANHLLVLSDVLLIFLGIVAVLMLRQLHILQEMRFSKIGLITVTPPPPADPLAEALEKQEEKDTQKKKRG